MAHSGAGRGLDRDAVAFVQGGVAVGVGTRDDELRPSYTRAWGPGVSEDGRRLALCVIAGWGSTTRENIEGNGAIAAVFNPPTAGRALQLKGVVLDSGEPAVGQLERAERHFGVFADEAEQVGASRDNARRLFVSADFLAVTFSIDEVFDQTPGQRAGARW
jgi:hypothetical protein